MKNKVRPYVIDITIDAKYQTPQDKPFGTNPQDEWCVYASVDIGDRNVLEYINTPRRPWRKYPSLTGGKYNKNGSLGYLLGLTICSPSYKENPRDEDVGEIDKALVQQVFNIEDARARLTYVC